MGNPINLTLKYKILFCIGLWLTISVGLTYHNLIPLSNTIKHQQTSFTTLKQKLAAKRNMRQQIKHVGKHNNRGGNVVALLIKSTIQNKLQIDNIVFKKIGDNQEATLKLILTGSFDHIKKFLVALYNKNIALKFDRFSLKSNHDTAHSITFTGELTYDISS